MTTNQTNQTATAPTTIGTEIACGKNHSGNKTLHKMGLGRLAIYRECAGCGQIYTLDQLATL
jgi:hypothetical protein